MYWAFGTAVTSGGPGQDSGALGGSWCPQETWPFSPVPCFVPHLSPSLLLSPQKSCSSSPWRCYRLSAKEDSASRPQQILNLRDTFLEAKSMGATHPPPCTWPCPLREACWRWWPAHHHSHSWELSRLFLSLPKPTRHKSITSVYQITSLKKEKRAAVHHNKRSTPLSTLPPPPPAHPRPSRPAGQAVDQPGWSAARQPSPFLLLWAAWGSLLSISVMNSDSPGKHLFAQNITRGGVGEWRRRPPGKARTVTSRQVSPSAAEGAAKEPGLGSAARHAGSATVGGQRPA